MATEKTHTPPAGIYPAISIGHIQKPNRFYAFFLIGFLVKCIILIPQFFEIIILGIIYFILSIINSLVVLFTGKYWDTAYTFILGFMRFEAKIYYYFVGLTDTYPGFDFSLPDGIKVDIAKPTNPSRFFAFPVIGGLVRIIFLIPYGIYTTVIHHGAWIGVVFSSFPVLFSGKYPESTYELARDSQRVALASSAYMSGFSDKYPSFWISMNHQTVKIILIILGALAAFGNFSADLTPRTIEDNKYQYQQQLNEFESMPQDSTNTSTY